MSLQTLITELGSASAPVEAEQKIQNYLKNLVGSKDADWLNGADVENNCPLGKPVDGNKCVSLLDKCLSGNASECVAEWGSMKWSAGFDDSTIDIGVAKNLVEKLQINQSNYNVENWIKAKSLTVTPQVKFALNKIVDKVLKATRNVNTSVPEATVSTVALLPLYSLVGGNGMIGGGNSESFNYLQLSNYLRNQFNLVGGAGELIVPNALSGLRESFASLQKVLANNGKKIDDNDVKRIDQLFDSLQSTEEKARKAAIYINGLRKLMAHPGFNNADVASPITVKMLQELNDKHKKLLESSSKKSLSIVSILDSVASAADVKALREDVAEIKRLVASKPTA